MSDVSNNNSFTGKYLRDPARAGEVTADVMMGIYDADRSGDLTRQELSNPQFEFDQAQFTRIAKDDKMSPEDIKDFVAARHPVVANSLAERSEHFKGLVARDQKALDDYRAEPPLTRLRMALRDAFMVEPGFTRAKRLPAKLALTRSLGARMLGDWLNTQR